MDPVSIGERAVVTEFIESHILRTHETHRQADAEPDDVKQKNSLWLYRWRRVASKVFVIILTF